MSVFTKAPGRTIKREEITEEFIYSFGKEIGKLHALTKKYKPKYLRHQWFDENYIDIGRRNLKKEDLAIIGKMEEIISKLRKADNSIDSHGLIHADLHFGNIFVTKDSMTFFDWDDSSYQPFINDFAVIAFDMVAYTQLNDLERAKKVNKFLIPLFKGYEEENNLNKEWFNYFHLFMKYREAVMFIMIKAAGEKVSDSPFGQRYLNGRLEKIMNDVPFLNMETVLKDIL